MKNLLLMAVLAVAGYQGWQHYQTTQSIEPLYDEPYVAVYGRDSCSITQQFLTDLRVAGIDYEYYIVDNRRVADDLHAQMEDAGISTRRYNLPVVDVNGHLSVRPSVSTVRGIYGANR